MVRYDRMEALIKAKGWTKSAFLRRIDLNSSGFNDWLAGKASPDKHMPKIIEVLETTEAYLRGETDDPTPPPSRAMIKKVIEHLAKNPGDIPLTPEYDEMMTRYMEKVHGLDKK